MKCIFYETFLIIVLGYDLFPETQVMTAVLNENTFTVNRKRSISYYVTYFGVFQF